MATPLIRKIEENFLSCCICFEELKDPIGLPCLHGFCFDCLERWFKSTQRDQVTVICPTCTKTFPKPKEGIRGFPGHFLIKNLKETVDSEKKMTVYSEKKDVNVTGTTCIRCGKQAEKHCTDCNKSLCGPCLRNHDEFIKDHRAITMEEYQSGQVTDEGRFCKIHGEQVRYYCETEEKGVCTDCVGLKTCLAEHHRIRLKEAAEKQRLLLEEQTMECLLTKTKFEDAIKKVNTYPDKLKISTQETMTELEQLESEYIRGVKAAFQYEKEKVAKTVGVKHKTVDNTLHELELGLSQLESILSKTSEIQISTSEYLVTHNYTGLSTELAILSQSEPQAPDDDLGFLKFEPVALEVPFLGHVIQHGRWQLTQLFIAQGLSDLSGIAVDEQGSVIVGCREKGIKVYTTNGQLKQTIHGSGGTTDVAISPDNRCVFKPRKVKYIQCNDMQGNKLFTSDIFNVHNKASTVNSITVDSRGRIIVGQVENTVSIHHAEGTIISKFATPNRPRYVAVSPNGEIVISFYNPTNEYTTSVVLMDYSGSSKRVIQRPKDVRVWRPYYQCFGHGEIFVGNSINGDPTGVYRFTSEGKYLGCVTTQVNSPRGIALSKDGAELYVAEQDGYAIKVFSRV